MSFRGKLGPTGNGGGDDFPGGHAHRGEKLAAEIQSALQQVFAKGLSDPRMDGSMLTITSVMVNSDNKMAYIAVSVLPEKHENRVRAALTHGARFLRRECGELVRSVALPNFEFRIDSSLKRQAGVMQALAKVAEERPLEAASATPADADPSSGPVTDSLAADNPAPGVSTPLGTKPKFPKLAD